MAWAVKYRLEIKELQGIDWKVDIEEDAFGGAITDLTGTGNPLTREINNESDDVFDPIRSSRFSINVWASTSFALADLYTVQDMQFRMRVYQNAVLYWTGYVIPRHYEEPYDCIPYPVTITAACGLELLQNILYASSVSITAGVETVTYYDGRRYESQVVLDILLKIGYTTFAEYVNIYEESMAVTVNDSPMDQIKIDVDVFKGLYCDEVLKQLLVKYNACIVQRTAVFSIYRPVELIGATVYGRLFTAATTKTSVTITPLQYINRSTHATTRRDIQGGAMMIAAPAKKVSIIQDYGYRESWLENWKFEGSRWSGGGVAVWEAEGWTRTGIAAAEIYPISIGDSKDADGVVLTGVNALPGDLSHYISQSFGTYAIVAAEVMCFEFEYKWFNRSGASRANQYIYFSIRDGAATIHLSHTDESYAQWDAGDGTLYIVETVPDGDSEWKTYKKFIPGGIDAVGPYTIKIYSPDDDFAISIGIRNVRFYATSDSIAVRKRKHKGPFPRLARWILRTPKYIKEYIDVPETVEKHYIIDNSINGIDLLREYLLGDVVSSGIDNVIEQFMGSLAVSITTLLARVDDVTLSSDTASGIANITVNGHAETAVWNTSLAQTATDFITNHNGDFPNVNVATGGAGIIKFTGAAGATLTVTIANNGTDPDLTGTVANTQPLTSSEALTFSTDWNTRSPGSESKELLQIIGDEIAKQYSRPKQLIQLPVYDTGAAVSAIDILGNFQDDLNQIAAANRKFVFNRGTFDIKNRRWDIDLVEIVE